MHLDLHQTGGAAGAGEEESKLLICRSFFHLKLHGGNATETPRGRGSLKSVPHWPFVNAGVMALRSSPPGAREDSVGGQITSGTRPKPRPALGTCLWVGAHGPCP